MIVLKQNYKMLEGQEMLMHVMEPKTFKKWSYLYLSQNLNWNIWEEAFQIKIIDAPGLFDIFS